MTRKPKKASSSWRNIQQANKRGKTTKVARQRSLKLFLRSAVALLLFIVIITGVVAIYYLGGLGKGTSVRFAGAMVDVKFASDGVLTENWFRDSFSDTLRMELRQIDVGVLKEQLERYGQVSTAEVTLSLPSHIEVALEEREPILRMRVRNEDGSSSTLLIARDGTIYRGALYPAETLRNLPGVAGLRVRKDGTGYQPVTGLEAVAFLLDTAQKRLPAVYRHWQVVDLSDWNPEVDYRPSLVKVKSTHIEEIVFSTYGIEEQIERLAGILQHIQRHQLAQPKLIDLSFGEEAVIR
ncbi:MAG: cell division protein FtsQ/DivIB [Puniceicoccaceae bacterium]